MTSVVLDASPLIAVDRGDRDVLRRLRAALEDDFELRTHAMVVGQVWRNSRGRQAALAQLLRGVEVAAVDEPLGRRAGELCGAASADDPIDAAVALLAAPGDIVLTGDPDDMRLLLQAAGTSATVVSS